MGRVLDLTPVTSIIELHDLLASFFGFPEYYGRNWDAFDECIADFPPTGTLTIRGFQRFQNAFPRDAHILKKCLDGVAAENPGLVLRYE
jgi:RNAse (barnase) inhibitor barstar